MAKKIDIAIIGAGPAGIASAIYLKRAGLSPVVFERDEPGGLLLNANLVENYPGFPKGISGLDLVSRMIEQLNSNNIKIEKETVKSVDHIKNGFEIVTDSQNYFSRNVILATGTRPKKIELRGINRITRKRVFYEIVKLPIEEEKRKRILIIGGGDAAFDYAINLRNRGHRAIIVSRSEMTCLPLLKRRARKAGIQILSEVELNLVKEEKNEIILIGRRKQRRIEIKGDYLLIACGREPNLTILSSRLKKNLFGKFNPPRTNVPGLYMIGDVIRGKHRQTGVAVGDGVLAAMLIADHMIESEVEA